jgi:hypothetical protein
MSGTNIRYVSGNGDRSYLLLLMLTGPTLMLLRISVLIWLLMVWLNLSHRGHVEPLRFNEELEYSQSYLMRINGVRLPLHFLELGDLSILVLVYMNGID